MQRYFVFTVFVFGLATAPFIFTKVVKELIKHWGSMAIRIFAFVDDILGGGRSKEEASRISSQVKKDLEFTLFGLGFCQPKKTLGGGEGAKCPPPNLAI